MRPRIVWDPSYEVDIGDHVFVTAKYRLTRELLLERGVASEADFLRPVPATREQLERVHTRAYLDKVESGSFTAEELFRLEIPYSPEGRDAMILVCGGTLLAGRSALERGVAGHLGGGFHHAFPGHGEGFCLLNDVAVAARALLDEGAVERVAVVDLDVHQGNGTAAIFADDASVFTFSMHQEDNYPAVKPRSDLDVGLPDRTGDAEYLQLLGEHLPAVLEGHRPDLVFYLAGADPYEEDRLGGLALTREGLRRRDRMVLTEARARGVPVAVLPAGGYALRVADTVEIHAATFEELMRAAER
ncbi:MAG TPA: histone deacetylase [Longimicrobiales bacterium]|nr:histone deacetylase [Longimicrobiales bacterium]